MHWLGRITDRISRIGILISEIALLALLVLTVYAVLSRYVLHRPSIHAFELSAYLLVVATWMAAGWVSTVDRHVSMEALSQRLNTRWRAISRAIGHATVLVFCTILVVVGTASVIDAIEHNYRSASLLAFPLWAAYVLIPIGAGVLGLVEIQKFISALRLAFGETQERA